MSKTIQWTEEYIRNGAIERGGKLVEIISGKGSYFKYLNLLKFKYSTFFSFLGKVWF